MSLKPYGATATPDVYLKPHGTDIATSADATIHKLYPNDSALGYSKGQIQGAFSFSKALQKPLNCDHPWSQFIYPQVG
ncbi:MAG: hypothetical protein ACQEQR_01190 [Pseudomonadota bacterium]